MSAEDLKDLFAKALPQPERRQQILAKKPPKLRYLIAMTPRSGSSWLGDVLKSSQRMGHPDEMLSESLLPEILQSIPGQDADDYLNLLLRELCSSNGVAGIKVSWEQFKAFASAMREPSIFQGFRFVYLTRRDLAAQAVSLYTATKTNVFHTNVDHSPDEWRAVEELPYSFEGVRYWYEHLRQHEEGWSGFFAEHDIFPLAISYEDIEHDVVAVAQRIAAYIGRPKASQKVRAESVFKKVGTRRNVTWAARFRLELDQLQRTQNLPTEAA